VYCKFYTNAIPLPVISRKTAAKRRAPTPPAGTLDRDAWLAAATDAIAEGGFGAARILTLAQRLGVTRGSFYWHFRNHGDFVAQLLERWRDEQLRALASWRPDGGDAEADLRRAVRLLLADMARDGRSLRVELAVQDFARRNPLAATVTVDVNRARTAQGLALFEALTGDRERARALTLLLYACITGARLMLAATARSEKIDAIAARLDRVIGDAIITPVAAARRAPRSPRAVAR
jgi:AcrR family transcriptional regulator